MIEKIIAIAEQAGEAILEIYQQDFSVEIRSDDSPLTWLTKMPMLLS